MKVELKGVMPDFPAASTRNVKVFFKKDDDNVTIHCEYETNEGEFRTERMTVPLDNLTRIVQVFQ